MDIPRTEMKKLEEIMNKISLYPVRGTELKHSSPIDRLIFCQVLAIRYPELIDNLRMGTGQYPRTAVREFLGYTENVAVKHQLREGAIESIKGYKEYYHKYLLVKAAYLNDTRYQELVIAERERDDAQNRMNELMESILTE